MKMIWGDKSYSDCNPYIQIIHLRNDWSKPSNAVHSGYYNYLHTYIMWTLPFAKTYKGVTITITCKQPMYNDKTPQNLQPGICSDKNQTGEEWLEQHMRKMWTSFNINQNVFGEA